MDSNDTGPLPKAAEALADWRAAEQGVAVARRGKLAAETAAAAAAEAVEAAQATADAARASLQAATLAEASAAKTAQAARLVAATSLEQMAESDIAVGSADILAAEAHVRYTAAVNRASKAGGAG